MLNERSTLYRRVIPGDLGRVPILFLHSLGTDHRLWRYQVEGIRGRTLVCMDSRGHGKSTTQQPVHVAAWVDDILDVMNDAEISQAVICGVSMGGVQALSFANAHPDRVCGLVLADTFIRIPEAERDTKIAGTGGKAVELGMAAYADAYLDATLTSSQTAQDLRGELHDAISRMSVTMYYTSAAACFTADAEPGFSGVSTLVLIGEQDYKTPLKLSEEIVERISGSRLEAIPNAAHLSNVDNPVAFNHYLTSFMAEVDE